MHHESRRVSVMHSSDWEELLCYDAEVQTNETWDMCGSKSDIKLFTGRRHGTKNRAWAFIVDHTRWNKQKTFLQRELNRTLTVVGSAKTHQVCMKAIKSGWSWRLPTPNSDKTKLWWPNGPRMSLEAFEGFWGPCEQWDFKMSFFSPRFLEKLTFRRFFPAGGGGRCCGNQAASESWTPRRPPRCLSPERARRLAPSPHTFPRLSEARG